MSCRGGRGGGEGTEEGSAYDSDVYFSVEHCKQVKIYEVREVGGGDAPTFRRKF